MKGEKSNTKKPAKKTADKNPESFTTSGRDELLEVMTGIPHCMASSGGNPNPS